MQVMHNNKQPQSHSGFKRRTLYSTHQQLKMVTPKSVITEVKNCEDEDAAGAHNESDLIGMKFNDDCENPDEGLLKSISS